MNLIQMQSMVKKHWREHCPQKAQELKAAGTFEAEAHRTAMRAQKRKGQLVKEGYRDYEADEVITRQILLADLEEVEDEEELAAEREYQERELRLLRAEVEFVQKQEEEDMRADGLHLTLNEKEWKAEMHRRMVEDRGVEIDMLPW